MIETGTLIITFIALKFGAMIMFGLRQIKSVQK